MLAILVIHIIITGIFILLGVIFSWGKGASLIAGYNTASAAEQKEYDEKKLCKFMGKLMFALAACWLVVVSSEIFNETYFIWIGLCLFFIVIIAGIAYANTGNRFKNNFSQ